MTLENSYHFSIVSKIQDGCQFLALLKIIIMILSLLQCFRKDKVTYNSQRFICSCSMFLPYQVHAFVLILLQNWSKWPINKRLSPGGKCINKKHIIFGIESYLGQYDVIYKFQIEL